MLNFVFGSAGSGKTTYLNNLLKALVNEGVGGLVLIVPEQFSFESEKNILRLLGEREGQKVEVSDFTRLARNFLSSRPENAVKQIDDAGRAMLMSVALEQTRDRLSVYGRFSKRVSAVSEMLALSDELKQCAVLPQQLEETAAKLGGGFLSSKLSDIALITAAYDALVSEKFADPRDQLAKYCSVLGESRCFKGKTVFIDGFRGFTGQELKIIEHILTQSDNVYVALCADSLFAPEPDLSVYAHVCATAKKLHKIAKENSVQVKVIKDFKPHLRSLSPALMAIEKGLFVPGSEIYADETEAVTVYTASDAYDECDFVAMTIRKLLREEGLRCREIAVLSRSDGGYSRAVRAALKKYDVPVFEDDRKSLKIQPLIVFVTSSLEIAAAGFATDSVLRLLKTELFGLSVEETAEVENYAYIWNINGNRWLEEWTANPSGFGNELSLFDKEKLMKLNALREKIVSPLQKFRNSMKTVDGEGAAKAIYLLLKSTSVGKNLFTMANALEESGERAAITEQSQVYETLIGILDQTAFALAGRPVSAGRYLELFSLVLSLLNMGTIPHGLDEILVGSADRTRTNTPKVVFIVGANAGVFPAECSTRGLLNDSERKKLAELGVDITNGGEYKFLEERFIAYNALCSPSERLYVTCCNADFGGKAATPSELVSEVQRLVPGCRVLDFDSIPPEERIESIEPAFEMTASLWNNSGELSRALKNSFEHLPEYSDSLSAIGRAVAGDGFKLDDTGVACELFGNDMYLTASRAEVYYKCPFQYFCRYGLKAKPRLPAQLDPMVSGTIIHFVLENIVRKFGKELPNLDDAQIAAETEMLLNEYLEKSMGGINDKTDRFVFLYSRLRNEICEVIKRLAAQFLASDFVPSDFELPIGDNEEVKAYEIPLPDGGSIRIHGFVDRVDVMEENGKSFLRVVDYKSGTKKFALSDVLQGLNMQMLIYLFAIWQNGGEKYGDICPAGVLYVPAGVRGGRIDRLLDDSEIENQRLSEGKMSGIVLDDARVIYGMEKDCRGVFIPVKKDKNGNFTGELITLSQLGELKRRVEETLADMGLALHSGKIGAVPAYGGNYKAICDYCDYKAVCSHGENSPVREFDALKTNECTKILETEVADDEQ